MQGALGGRQPLSRPLGCPVATSDRSPAKTVADCFKCRNKIGMDIALEALREIRRSRLATTDELFQMAKICRVANVMRPYLQAMS